MSKDEFFDYLVSLFGTISAHEAVRDIQARWRRDKSERDHLRYVLSREPAQVGEQAEDHMAQIDEVIEAMLLERAGQVERLMADRDEWRQKVWDAEKIAASPPPPTPDEALREALEKIAKSRQAGRMGFVEPVEVYITRIKKIATDALAALSRARPTDADMRAFGASEAACYKYPGEDQAELRSAYCEGVADCCPDDRAPRVDEVTKENPNG